MQHFCGYHLDAEDVDLGICPFCLESLSDPGSSLSHLSLDEIVQFLGNNFQNICNFDHKFYFEKVENEGFYQQPNKSGDIVYEYNPKTGNYDYQIGSPNSSEN